MQVGILKRVLEEVEKVMSEFRGMLYQSMEDPQLDLAEVSLFLLSYFLKHINSDYSFHSFLTNNNNKALFQNFGVCYINSFLPSIFVKGHLHFLDCPHPSSLMQLCLPLVRVIIL